MKLRADGRAGLDPEPLLEAQRASVVPAVEALESRLAASGHTERILVHFRLESTRAVVHFIDSLLAERRATPATAATPH